MYTVSLLSGSVNPSLRFAVRLAFLLLLAAPLTLTSCSSSHPGDEAAPPRVGPAQTISLRPIGYEMSTATSLDPAPADGVFFINSDYVLVTGRHPSLLHHMPDSLPQDDDRLVRASVLEIASGKLVASADWRLHDHNAFFWPLAEGKFLLRIRNELFVTDESLRMHSLLRSKTPIKRVEAAPDGRLIVVETELERHTPSVHQQMLEKARTEGAEPPTEDVRVLVIRPEGRTVVAEARERQPVSLALMRDGFVEVNAERSSRWQLRYVPFAGKARDLGQFVSHCEVTLRALNQDTLLLGACVALDGGRGVVAINMEGKTLWTVPPRRDLAMPRFSVSADGNEVALSRLALTTPAVTRDMAVHVDQIAGQRVDVMDMRTGAVRLTEQASPSLGNAHNYALSDDGRRFAVLKAGNLEIFDIQVPQYSSFRSTFAEHYPPSDSTPFNSYHQFRPRELPLDRAGLDITAESPELLALAPGTRTGSQDAEIVAAPFTGPETSGVPVATETTQPLEGASVLHLNSRLILVDVVVTDRGKPVRGLEKNEFHILENGHEQIISSFEESQAGETLKQKASSAAPEPANTYTNVPAAPSSGALNVLLLDSLNTPITEQSEVFGQVKQYMQHLRPGTLFAIFALNRKLQMVSGFTSDPALLARAMQSKAAQPQMSVAMDNNFAASLRSAGDAAAANAPKAMIGAADQALAYNDAADVAAAANTNQIRMTLEGLGQLGHYLSSIPGRKNLIWFSGSFPIELFPAFTGSQPVGNTAASVFASSGGPDGSMQSRNDSESGDLIQDMARLLQAARVAVYPVYAMGPAQSSTLSAQYNLGDHHIQGVNDVEMQGNDVQTANQDTLRMLASESGGEYTNTNDFRQALEHAVANGSHYYTLGYVPGDHRFTGGPRSIKVRLDRSGYTLAYRRSFFAEPGKAGSRNARAKAALQLAAAPGAPPSTQVEFQTRILPVTDPLFKEAHLSSGPVGDLTARLKGPLHRYVIDLAVNPHDVTFQDGADGEHLIQLDCLLAAFDDSGKRVNSLEQTISLHLNPMQVNHLLQTNILHRMELDLQPGHYIFHLVVFDPASTHTGTLDVPVDVSSH